MSIIEPHSNDKETVQDAVKEAGVETSTEQAETVAQAEAVARTETIAQAEAVAQTMTESSAEASTEKGPTLQEMQQELEKQKELWLRAKADAENALKKAVREVRNARLYAVEGFALQLLEVKDNLERSLAVAQEASAQANDLYTGVELTLKLLNSAFEKHGMTECQAEKQPFNPEYHQAMQVLESEEYPANTILTVIQKGYFLHDRLIRPAMVVVSKAVSQQDSDTQKTETEE